MDHRSIEGSSLRQTVEQKSHLGGPREDSGRQFALRLLVVRDSAYVCPMVGSLCRMSLLLPWLISCHLH